MPITRMQGSYMADPAGTCGAGQSSAPADHYDWSAGVWPVCEMPPEAGPNPSLDERRESICDRPAGQDAFVLEQSGFAPFMSKVQQMPFEERLECISRRFLGIRYENDPLGEGEAATIDSGPLYSFGYIDCMTYVEEVVALARSSGAEEFLENLGCVRYRDCVPTYAMRNHHVEDWARENSARGFVKDITLLVGGSLVERATVKIDFGKWIDGKADLLSLQKEEIKGERAARGLLDPTPVDLDFIPMSALFAFDGESASFNREVVSLLPVFSVMLLIGKEEDEVRYGTRVRHMGVVLRNEAGSSDELVLRHCTPNDGCIDRPLLSYLLSLRGSRAGVAFLEVLGG